MSGSDIKNSLVSVIINCYNGEEYLREAIDSVFNQTYTNWEIVFWDNCSTDNSAEIAKSYGEKVKYFKATENKPLGEARNYALERTNGDFIAFIDCDDIWIPNKLELQVNLMEQNPHYVISYGSLEEIFLNGNHFRNVVNPLSSGYIFEDLLYQFDVSIITSMLNSRILKESGLKFDPSITASEEYCLFMQLASRYELGVFKEVLSKYRVHENSLTSKSLIKLGFERRYTLDKIIIENPNLKIKFAKAFKEAYARADYYDARWFISQNQRLKAFKQLFPSSLVNARYFALTLLTLGPKKLWDFIHYKLRNRT